MNIGQGWQQEMEQRLRKMEQSMEQLFREVQKLSKKETTYVEKIEYKFDQLKVETVEGTLHIGVLPGNHHAQTIPDPHGYGEGGHGLGLVEADEQANGTENEVYAETEDGKAAEGNGFSGGPYDLQFSARAQTEIYQKAKQRIDQYVNNDLPDYIQTLQEEHSYLLGEQYVKQMVYDIQMQCEGRILYYLNQMNLPQDQKAAEDEVVKRTTRDIQHAVKQHIESFQIEKGE